jgi:hypothetical protein
LVRRLTFDTESNYYRNPSLGIGSIEHHREFVTQMAQTKGLRFDCAVVHDNTTELFHEFRDNQIDELLTLLGTADELVTHSGKRVDLPILERFSGRADLATLWAKTHHDLMEIYDWQSLANLSDKYLKQDDLALMKDRCTRRCQNNLGADNECFIQTRLAKANFDVERTVAVFDCWLRSISAK